MAAITTCVGAPTRLRYLGPVLDPNEEDTLADEAAIAAGARLGPHESRVWVPADVIEGRLDS